MSTSAQIVANRANSQLSTGPKTETGKAAAARNNIRHGLASASAFKVLPTESQFEFDELLAGFRGEHRPVTPTEEALVQAMVEHHWLRNRAVSLEGFCFDDITGQVTDAQRLSLYLRYQTTHERAFHKSLNALQKLRAEKRKAEIGFECAPGSNRHGVGNERVCVQRRLAWTVGVSPTGVKVKAP